MSRSSTLTPTTRALDGALVYTINGNTGALTAVNGSPFGAGSGPRSVAVDPSGPVTTSPDGEPVQVHHRLAEIYDRYGPDHLVSRTMRRATPLILEAVCQINARAGRA